MINIYLYTEDSQKKALVARLCRIQKLTMKELKAQNLGQTLSEVTGLPQSIALAHPSGIEDKTPPPFYQMPEVMLLAGMDGGKVNRFLDSFKSNKIKPIALKAMITPYSIGWTLYELIEHLKLEAAKMKG